MPNAGKDRFKPEPRTYDALINWQRRLERETPFYRRLFERLGVKRVLDVACGTGRHARMFHSWGLTVEGADVSPEMLAHCRSQTGESDTLRWVERSFDQPAPAGAPFDAAICVGNSLAIAPDLKAVGEVLRAMTASVRPGGALVIQVLNLWRIAEGSITWQKCGRIQDDDGDRIFLKGIHRSGACGYVEVATLTLSEDDVDGQYRTATILAIERDDLIGLAEAAGAAECVTYGGYDDSPYDRQGSTDLILVARRSLAAEGV